MLGTEILRVRDDMRGIHYVLVKDIPRTKKFEPAVPNPAYTHIVNADSVVFQLGCMNDKPPVKSVNLSNCIGSNVKRSHQLCNC